MRIRVDFIECFEECNVVFVPIRSERRLKNNMADFILMLNDDCLLEIFKDLSLLELANFKEAYGSLGAVAEIQFSRKSSGSLNFDGVRKIDENLQIIKQFGGSVIDLNIYYRSGGTKLSDIFAVVSEHCNKNLKTLALCGEAIKLITKSDILLIADVLKNVETLEIGNDISVAESIDILSHCENATSITSYSNIDINVHKTILRKNKNLLKLEWFAPIEESHLKTFVDNLMHNRLEILLLNILKTDLSGENVARLIRFVHLKRLTLFCGNVDISHFLRNVNSSNSLNVLSLSLGQLDETNIAALRQIKQLNVLKLNFCSLPTNSFFDALLALCGNQNFEHLQFLSYRTDFKNIDEQNFQQIIETRNEFRPENCLHLTVRRKIYTASLKAIPSELLEANKATIKLIDEWDRSYEYYNL